MVFLHGMGGVGALWRPIAAHLEEEYSVLAPDQRGHGGSRDESLTDFSPLAYGQDVVETIHSLNFHPCVFIGHSMGVRTACAVAHLKPEWTQGLVLIDLNFSGGAGGKISDILEGFLAHLPPGFPSREKAREYLSRECPDPSIAQYLMAVSQPDGPKGKEGLCFPFDREALVQTIQQARSSSVREWIADLGKKGMPILILRGAKSLVWSHEEFEREQAAVADIPSIRFVEMEGAGHGLPFEKRVEFLALLGDWLAENLKTGALPGW